MLDRPESGENALLVHVNVLTTRSQEDFIEFQELANAAGAVVLASIAANCSRPNPKYFIGSGKAEELRQLQQIHNASLILVNHELSPTQQRNLEKLIGCRVINRTELILDIFAKRARTFEGKLQVELAQLQHLSTRLIRGWTHLERQKGGIGLRGPGETQLETDRRLIRIRIKTLEKRLEKVKRQRDQSRRGRVKASIPTVSIVGYTNAGKSTLFNRLTKSSTFVANQLFATLDPTLRQFRLSSGRSVVLADTVGFIRHLPHDLIAAFRATLLETQEASLLLHVIDVHNISQQDHISQVNEVLKEIAADQIPQIEIYNKIDLVSGMTSGIERDKNNLPNRIWLSAETGAGLELLREALGEWFV